MRLRVCTSNKGKAEEIRRILKLEIEMVSIDLEEIQSLDPAKVSAHKALQAFDALGEPVIVDDTALHLDALDGFPGALVAFVLKTRDIGLLYRMIPPGGSQVAQAVTTIGFADAAGVTVFTGATAGTIIARPFGDNGFGFDPIFTPEGHSRTFAEMTGDEKDALSPRRKALQALSEFLAGGSVSPN